MTVSNHFIMLTEAVKERKITRDFILFYILQTLKTNTDHFYNQRKGNRRTHTSPIIQYYFL